MKFLSQIRKLNTVVNSLSITEKILFGIFAVILFVSTLSMLIGLNANFLVDIPTRGGSLRAGIVGTSRFINPVLAVSDTDQDLTALVFSGLMRIDEDGELIHDLARSHSVSDDGLIYTFNLRNNAVFHDGTPVTADDIVFTIHAIQDPSIKSPYRGNWDGITVQKIDQKKVEFHLHEPYNPFIWNTTIGILPQHIWKDVSTEEFAFNLFNTDPIGSGPYKVSDIERNESGIVNRYVFESFKDFSLGEPFIEKFELFIFNNDEDRLTALHDGLIDNAVGLMPETVKDFKEYEVKTFPLTRIFAIFLNQNQANIFAQTSVREALNISIDKEGIVENVLNGYANPEYGPIPSGLFDYSHKEEDLERDERIKKAEEILENAGWEKGSDGILYKDKTPLKFSLSTNNIPELTAVAESVIATWKKLGADVELKVFESTDLRQNVIRPREYDALLFGEVVGHDLDVYAFWHSSQRNDPGLNIASYVNIDTDKYLEDIRTTTSDSKKKDGIENFISEIEADTPAFFLYSPKLIYLVSKKLNGLNEHQVVKSSDRFATIYKWHIEQDKVWKIFK